MASSISSITNNHRFKQLSILFHELANPPLPFPNPRSSQASSSLICNQRAPRAASDQRPVQHASSATVRCRTHHRPSNSPSRSSSARKPLDHTASIMSVRSIQQLHSTPSLPTSQQQRPADPPSTAANRQRPTSPTPAAPTLAPAHDPSPSSTPSAFHPIMARIRFLQQPIPSPPSSSNDRTRWAEPISTPFNIHHAHGPAGRTPITVAIFPSARTPSAHQQPMWQ
ncbi:hypothetical protein ACLOJK_023173 [Asimina triloba]